MYKYIIYHLPFVHIKEKLEKECTAEKVFYDIYQLKDIGQKGNNQMIIDACNNAKKNQIEYNKLSKTVSILMASIVLCAVYIYVHGYKIFWNDFVYYNRMEN